MKSASICISECPAIKTSMGTRFPASHWARCSARISAIRLFIAISIQAQFFANPVQRSLVCLAHSFGGSSADVGNLLPTPTFPAVLDNPLFQLSQSASNLAKYLLVRHDLTR